MILNPEKIRIDLEVRLENEIYNLLEGEIVEAILKEARYEPDENSWKNMLEGHSFKVTREMAPTLYSLFNEVKEKLSYSHNIDFYVTNSPELNAFAVPRTDEKDSDIINVYSGMISMLDDDELRFVIGHEIGHLISRYARITKLINFVYPNPSAMPLIIKHKIELWQKLSELTSDRFGYIASPDLEKCVSGFFKMASGLNTNRIHFDYQAYLDDNERILEYFADNRQVVISHPINPVRIKSINLFGKSELYRAIMREKEIPEDKALSEETDKLIEVLLTLSSSEMDYYRKHFIAAGGLLMAGLDESISEEEAEVILLNLSFFTVFPKEFLGSIYNSGNVKKIFEDSVKNILGLNPAERTTILEYLANIVISDNEINQKEMDFVYDTGQNLLGMSRREIAQLMANVIQGRFIPKLYS